MNLRTLVFSEASLSYLFIYFLLFLFLGSCDMLAKVRWGIKVAALCYAVV